VSGGDHVTILSVLAPFPYYSPLTTHHSPLTTHH
jgi:hypothetical protein